jgi:hypothetical protein
MRDLHIGTPETAKQRRLFSKTTFDEIIVRRPISL